MIESRGRTADHTVLVVGGDAAMRRSTRETLEVAGVKVEEAENGTEALAAFARVRPDLMLVDVVMPAADGFAVCSKLRELPGGHDVTIVMVTDAEDRDSVHRSYEVGATDFITKPINQPILTHRVRYLLRARETILSLIHISEPTRRH